MVKRVSIPGDDKSFDTLSGGSCDKFLNEKSNLTLDRGLKKVFLLTETQNFIARLLWLS